MSKFEFLVEIENIIKERKNADINESYIADLYDKGIEKIAQKVGDCLFIHI